MNSDTKLVDAICKLVKSHQHFLITNHPHYTWINLGSSTACKSALWDAISKTQDTRLNGIQKANTGPLFCRYVGIEASGTVFQFRAVRRSSKERPFIIKLTDISIKLPENRSAHTAWFLTSNTPTRARFNVHSLYNEFTFH